MYKTKNIGYLPDQTGSRIVRMPFIHDYLFWRPFISTTIC